METSMNIYEKLTAIQQEIKVPKDQNNDFAGFKYRSAEDILEKVKPLLDKHKVSLTLSDKAAEIAGQVYIKAIATLRNNEGEDFVTTEALAREEKSRPKMSEGQLTGAASSYARKYALGGLLLLDDNKDPDSMDNRTQAPKKAQVFKPAAPKPDPLALAKDELNKMLESFSYDNVVKKKAFISKVLGKSTIETVEEAEQVMTELTAGGES